MENGNTCPFECKYCGSQNSIHANKVFAKESKIALFLAILVFLLGTAGIVWWVYILFAKNENMGQPALIAQLFGLVTIPSMVYYVIAREDAKRVRIFNAGKVRNNS
mgnify:FL=1